jgi:hypothetical protein
MLVLASAVDNGLTPPTGWNWLAPSGAGSGLVNLMYGIVGQGGLTAATSYSFGGNSAVTQLLEIAGMSKTIAPSVSSDPTDYGLTRTRNLTIPSTAGLGLIVWGARSDTATGGYSSITDALSPGEVESRLTNSINNSMPAGSALTLAVSQLTTDPFKVSAPFTVAGTFATGSAPNESADGYVVWLHP